MKKLLISTTALSVALSPFHVLPSMAQTLLDDGSVVATDGAVLCVPTAEVACDLDAIMATLKATEEAAAAAAAEAAIAAQVDAQAQADAAAAAQAEADAAAAAQAQADAAVAAQAEADAAAQAEAEAAAAAAAQAEAEAAANAAAAAQAEADAQAQADAAAAQAAADAAAAADAQAQADADAAAQAEADAAAAAQAQADADAAIAAQAEADAKAAADAAAAAETAAPETAAPETAAPETAITEVPAVEPTVEPTVDPATEAPAEVAPEATTEAPADPATEAPAESTTDAAPAATPETTPETTTETTAETTPEVVVEAPVEAPVPEQQAVDTLTNLLVAPSATDGGVEDTTAAPVGAAAAALAAAAAAALAPAADGTTPAPAPAADAPPAPPVVETVVTEQDTRSSDEEFTAAPTAVEGGKKSGLSNLEKVGLVALGALVVGAILKDGREVVQNSGDRVVVKEPDGRYVVYKDDDVLLRQPGVRTLTESYDDGSTRTVVQRADGTQVVTIRDASGRVLRRSAFDQQGVEVRLIDDLQPEERIVIRDLPRPNPSRTTISTSGGNAALTAELAALEAAELGRKFSLRQIREVRQVRELAATIEVDTITFDSGSSVIKATEARKLADLGRVMGEILDRNPGEVFLIEGHTDAVGSAASNLSLSDRRAESLALALTEYFDVPPENLVVQGYGEAELKVDTARDERLNRRVAIRLITPLMRSAAN